MRPVVVFREGLHALPLTLAASDRGAQQALWDVSLWIAVVLIVLGLSAAVLASLRKRLYGDPTDQGPVLSLQDVRRLRDTGRLTIAEYERLAKAIAESTLERRADPRPKGRAR